MARKTIANLNIQLSAGTATLRRDFRQAQAAAQRFGQGIRRQQTVMRRFAQVSRRAIRSISAALTALKAKLAPLLAMGTALASTAVGIRGITRQFEELDRLAKTSRALGIAVDDLRGMELAAERAGMSAERFGSSLERMTRGVGDAIQGTGTAAAAFEQLGLSARELADAGPAEALRQIADAFSRVDGAAERTALAARIFGRTAGIEMANMLASGRMSLDEATEAIIRLQGSLNDIDLTQVEKANDAINEMRKSLEGVAQRIALAFSPEVKDAAKAIEEMAIEMRGFVDENRDALVFLGRAFRQLWEVAGPPLQLLTWLIAKIQAGLERLGMTVPQMEFSEWELSAEQIEKLNRAMERSNSHASDWAGGMIELNRQLKGVTGSASRLGDAVNRNSGQMHKWAGGMIALNKQWEEFARALEREYRTPFQVATDRIEELNQALRCGGLNWDVYTRAVEDAVEQLAEASGATEKAVRQAAQIGRVGAVTMRTQAGFAAVHGGQDALREAARMHRESLREQKEHTRILQDIRDELPIEVREVSLR